MTRHYVDYDSVNLMNLFIQLNTELSQLGHLYDNLISDYNNITDYQKTALEYSNEGWEVGDQIFCKYSHISSIYEEIHNRHNEGDNNQ